MIPALVCESFLDLNRLFLNAMDHSHITIIVIAFGIPFHVFLCYYFLCVRPEAEWIDVAKANICTQATLLFLITLLSSRLTMLQKAWLMPDRTVF